VAEPYSSPDDKASYREFAAPFGLQLWEVQKRVFEQYWRTPSYIYSKASLCIFSVRNPIRFVDISDIYRDFSSVSHSSALGLVSKNCRTNCSRSSCCSPFSVNWFNRLCHTLSPNVRFTRFENAPQNPTPGKRL